MKRARFAGMLLWVACCMAACLQTATQDARGAADALGAPTAQYTELASGPAAFVADAASAPLSAAIESLARVARTTLAGEARLARAAKLLLGELDAASPRSPQAFAQGVLQHLGSYDVDPDVLVLDLPSSNGARVLQEALAAKLSERAFTHYGAAQVANAQGSRLVIVLAEHRASLAAVAREQKPGGNVHVAGKLLGGVTAPRVVVVSPGARPTVVPLGAGPELELQLPLAARGVHRVELVGDDTIGTTTLARFVIHVGAAAPARFDVAALPVRVDLAAARAGLLERLNAERGRAGLAPLALEPTLSRIAERHGFDMRDHAFVDHASPITGTPAARVARAGSTAPLVLENVVRGTDAATLHAATLAQTDLRESLLDARVTQLGLGVVELPSGALLATQLLTGTPAPLDRDAVAARVLEALASARAARGVSALARSDELASVAQQAATRFVESAGATERAVVEQANAELQAQAATLRSVSTSLVLARSAQDVVVPEAALDPQVTVVGVGVAQGTRADRGFVLAVVFVLGVPR